MAVELKSGGINVNNIVLEEPTPQKAVILEDMVNSLPKKELIDALDARADKLRTLELAMYLAILFPEEKEEIRAKRDYLADFRKGYGVSISPWGKATAVKGLRLLGFTASEVPLGQKTAKSWQKRTQTEANYIAISLAAALKLAGLPQADAFVETVAEGEHIRPEDFLIFSDSTMTLNALQLFDLRLASEKLFKKVVIPATAWPKMFGYIHLLKDELPSLRVDLLARLKFIYADSVNITNEEIKITMNKPESIETLPMPTERSF